jgi:protein arginine N-methyltransferase 2
MDEVPSANLLASEEISAAIELGGNLINAILHGISETHCKRLVEAGAPLWYQDEEEGISALHAAAYTENKELVRLLIEEGALWNAGSFRSVQSFICAVLICYRPS